jgi:hypothetical protein
MHTEELDGKHPESRLLSISKVFVVVLHNPRDPAHRLDASIGWKFPMLVQLPWIAVTYVLCG